MAEESGVSKRLKLRIIFLLVFCLPGVAIVGYAMTLATETMDLIESGLSRTGVVVKYERPRYLARKPKLGSRLCPVVQFRHGDEVHSFVDEWCSRSPAEYPVGSVLPVVFDPEFPERARIDEFWELHGASLMSALIGTPWLLIGIALVIRIR